MRRSNNRGLGENVQQSITIETSLLSKYKGLGNCLHPDSQQAVHDKLHGCSGTARPQIKILSGDYSKDRLGGGDASLISAPEQGQRPLLGGRCTPRYGHVEHMNSTLGA